MGDKELIAALIDSADERRHNKAIELIFYGQPAIGRNGERHPVDNDYSRRIKQLVRIKYSGSKYAGSFDEIYEIIVSLICKDLVASLQRHGESVLKEGLLKHILCMVHNRSYRKEVDSYLWIDSSRKDDIDDHDIEDEVVEYFSTLQLQSALPKNKPTLDDDEDEQIATRADWAEYLVGIFVRRIPNPKYRDILQAIDIDGMTTKQYADKVGLTDCAVHQKHKEARIALIQVSLNEIQIINRALFVRFRHLLTSEEEGVLQNFFFEHEKNVDPKSIAIVYRSLLRKANKAMNEEEKDFNKRLKGREHAKKENKSK